MPNVSELRKTRLQLRMICPSCGSWWPGPATNRAVLYQASMIPIPESSALSQTRRDQTREIGRFLWKKYGDSYGYVFYLGRAV